MRVVFVHGACVRDGSWWWHRAAPARLQRAFARRAGEVVELDAGHHPCLSRPDAVCDLLLKVVQASCG